MPIRVAARGRAGAASLPLVADLSSLWAGPLCGHLVGLTGARVIRIESEGRPDGARDGPPGFFDLLHAGQESIALDLRSPAGRRALRRLLEAADVVIEASRPRALAQLGVDAAALVAARPGKVWLSITGYGRDEPAANWVAFGDDAGVAAGLAHVTGNAAFEQAPLFCGDAIADPLTGLYGAVAVLAARRRGGGVLLDVALTRVAAHALHAARPAPARTLADPTGWRVETPSGSAQVASPKARSASGRARPLGADTAPLLRELASEC
jgi:crotonobetainyl-CoA:carnitine CoA-transferase CaiB-like acyl-CoA transferase